MRDVRIKQCGSLFLDGLCSGNLTFPEMLLSILEDPNEQSIRWLDHGKSFIIEDRSKFVEQVLPRYFGKATQYTSFTRKLSRWKFRRMECGPEEGAWYNEKFTRGMDAASVKFMRCEKRTKKKKKRTTVTVAKPMPVRKHSSVPLKKRPVDTSLFEPSKTRKSSATASLMILSPPSSPSLTSPSKSHAPNTANDNCDKTATFVATTRSSPMTLLRNNFGNNVRNNLQLSERQGEYLDHVNWAAGRGASYVKKEQSPIRGTQSVSAYGSTEAVSHRHSLPTQFPHLYRR